jgi:hypothetical protein
MNAAEAINLPQESPRSKCQICDALRVVYRSFVSAERLAMRNALKYGKSNGWIAAEARSPNFPWLSTPRFWWERIDP